MQKINSLIEHKDGDENITGDKVIYAQKEAVDLEINNDVPPVPIDINDHSAISTKPLNNQGLCQIGYTSINGNCYQCSDPTVIPYYVPPMYAPSPSEKSSDVTPVGSYGVFRYKNQQQTNVLDTVIPGDQGKIVCDLKPYLTYDESTMSIMKQSFQCDGGAALKWTNLPKDVISPLDPGYSNNKPLWVATDSNGKEITDSDGNLIAQEPRCSLIIPF